MRQDRIYPRQDYEQVNSYKNSILYFIGWSFRNWKNAACLQLAESSKISTKVWENLLFVKIHNIFTMLCKRKLKLSSLCAE